MQPGDILYGNICPRPLCLMVERGDGQFWDFAASEYAEVHEPFDPKRFTLAMTPDATFPTKQKGFVPAAAAAEPDAELIEAMVNPGGARPTPTQSFWIGGGVPLSLARGATITFTG